MKKGKFLVFLFVFILSILVVVHADTLKVGSKGQAVTQLQMQLTKLGYFKGKATGYFGNDTKMAVKKYQVKKGFVATGSVDDKMNKRICEEIKNIQKQTNRSKSSNIQIKNSNVEKIKKAQTILKSIGLYKGKIDGICGSGTAKAIKLFQSKNKLKASGTLDANTEAKLVVVYENNQKAGISTASRGITESRNTNTSSNTDEQQIAVNPSNTGNTAEIQENPEGLTQIDTIVQAGETDDANDINALVTELKSEEKVLQDPGELLDWWTEVKDFFYIGAVSEVTDVRTGRKFKLVRTYGSNHADCETLTKEDTAIMNEIWGGELNWNRRPVIVEFNGKRIAASMAGMPHAGIDSKKANSLVFNRSAGYGFGYNLDKIKGNDMDGHFDVHFLNSRTHTTNKVNEAHQKAVLEAAGK